ncbi:uncharacterized protein [Epargyreus clarus]|uniref:uncharacterized protein n=1 Tax=Epargyreus clarus TaxID=520877 RepID=UPI003C2CD67E
MRGATNDAARSVPDATTEVRHAARARSPAQSLRSSRSTAATRRRLAEMEAEKKLAEIKKKQLEIEAELIKKNLANELATIQDEEDEEEGSVQAENLPEPKRKVDAWLSTQPINSRGEPRAEEQPHSQPRGKSPAVEQRMEELTEAMDRWVKPRSKCPDLPAFFGNINEWLIFRAMYRDTAKMYQLTPGENLQRLRSCLKGAARDTVAAALHAATDPEAIMKMLEQSYGQPEFIVEQAMAELKRLPRPGTSATELNQFAVKLQNTVYTIKSVNCQEYLYNPLLAREVREKLSPHLQARWCDYATEHSGADAEIVLLSHFLMREANQMLRHNYSSPATTFTKREHRPAVVAAPPIANKRKPNAVYNVAEEEQPSDICPSCEKRHKLVECPDYAALPVYKRWEFVRQRKLCFKCLKRKHRRSDCRSKSCDVNQCRRPHHSTLHQTYEEKQEPKPTEKDNTESVLTLDTSSKKTVLLKMCPVTVVGPRGEVKTYALLDEGATITLVDEEIARRIGAKGPGMPLCMQGVSTTQQENNSKLVTIHLKGEDEKLHKLRARTIKNMKIRQQSIPIALLNYEHLRDLPREQVCYNASRPGLLVGADHWECIVSQELRTGEPHQPAASRTQLGWVIHGTMPRHIITNQDSVLHVYTTERGEDKQDMRSLHDMVEHHFSIEALGVAHKPRVSDENKRAVTLVEQSIKKIEKGYEVGLPWKEDGVKLPQSYDAAFRRLLKIEQKMDADPNFKQEYTKQVENMIEKGYAEPCDGSERSSSVCWYLPHFAVQNPNKPGKQRLVFDAAAKNRGVSLNDHLLEGPDLLLALPGVLFRFREKSVAVTADIQEMFLQIKIRKEDQPAQQFLWRGDDRDKPPRHYKMTSMIFGAASSPFMAHFVRDYNAGVHAHTHPLAFEAITRSHYMDDLVASYEDIVEARRAITEIRTVHTAAGFNLRAWSANEVDVLQDVPKELRATAPTQLGGESITNKILGLYWNPERDELGFNTSMNRVPKDVRAQNRAPTKREALSAVMSIYDPLGLLSNYTIRAKIVLQSLWKLKISWDEPIPEAEQELFATWMEQLAGISHLRLERQYALGDCHNRELHILCDASEQAYAAVAYWRITRPDGSYCLSLIAAKSKVAPKRTQTIPRLELQAAVIGARLADNIKKEHRTEAARTIYWTDSMTVVHWVRHDAKRYTPFVAHRLGEISELTQKEEWRWVPTHENVADDATRFTSATITAGDRWFRGPDFLRLPEDQWPKEKSEDEDPQEEVVLHVAASTPNDDEWLPDPARVSKYETLVRAAARVLAFVDICRRRATRMEFQHIEKAEEALIRRAQRDSFPEELQLLKKEKAITKTSRLFRLDPILEDGILKIRGRIGAATAPTAMKRPVILDGRHHITRLLVQREHCAAGHANRERVTNDLRQRYWIVHLRPTVRAIERDCALCKRRKARPQVPATGDLPRERLEPFKRPFSYCGIDYFGPMVVKVGRRREKRWGALFTCLTTRAVHLEIVPSLSTNSAIMAMRRMAARRGWPRTMYSDNATNFRGADKELRAAYEEWAPALRDEGLSHRMEWRYIPPGAPNQGGAWERMVRSVKSALTATLNEKVPAEEVLHTLLTEAEYSINARPLTYVSVDPNDPEALTPNHFLLGSSAGLPYTGPCNEADRRTWRTSMALADQFWQRWVREYLPTLVPRGDSSGVERRLKSGDVVIIVDHTLPRNVWPMGVVERVYEGPDGGVRVADVRTKTGVFKRPVRKLVVMEATQAAPGGGAVVDDEQQNS